MICIPMDIVFAVVLAIVLSASWNAAHYLFSGKGTNGKARSQRISETHRPNYRSVYVEPTDLYDEEISKARAEKKAREKEKLLRKKNTSKT